MRPTTTLVAGALIASLAFLAQAGGPLTPPGPPAATPGPEPRTPINDLPGNALAKHVISAPGSYYLSGNIELTTPGLHGVYFDTPGPVSIDGMGFAVIGASGTGDAFHIFDDTGAPMRATVRNVNTTGWTSFLTMSSGPGDTNPASEDVLIIDGVNSINDGTSNTFLIAEATVFLKNGIVRGGGVRITSGDIWTDSVVFLDVDGAAFDVGGDLIMEKTLAQRTEGVMTTGKLVLKGSKILQNLTGSAIITGAKAQIAGNVIEGAVITGQHANFHDNVVVLDFDDPSFTPSSFGAGSRIEQCEFLFTGVATGQTGATATEEVAFYYNKFEFAGSGTPSSLVQFNGGQSEIAYNMVTGSPGGGAGFEVNAALNLVHDNTFVGAGDTSLGVMGTASRSIFRNNAMLNIGTPFALSGGGNYIGAALDPTTAPTNPTPDRNLEIPPVDPVR